MIGGGGAITQLVAYGAQDIYLLQNLYNNDDIYDDYDMNNNNIFEENLFIEIMELIEEQNNEFKRYLKKKIYDYIKSKWTLLDNQ